MIIVGAATMSAEFVEFAGQEGVGATVVLDRVEIGLKIGTPLTAIAMAPRKK